MQSIYRYNISAPNLETLGYVIAIANINDKHDRSTPSDYHWKVLKCRMIIFSNCSILASPDKKDVKQVHIIFNKVGDDYDKINSLFLKYSLVQDGVIRKATSDIIQMCFQYTMTAKIAPIWNTIGVNYLINNRDFLTAHGPQEGVKYSVICDENHITLELKPVKIHLIRGDDDFMPCEGVRVLPSLNNAIVEEVSERLLEGGTFKSYKDIRRHWKNIHGYRLPDEEYPYYMIRFWRGEALTYPKLCLTRSFPIITPIPKSGEKIILMQFLGCLKNKMTHILRKPLTIQNFDTPTQVVKENNNDTQDVSLCTPTQYSTRYAI